MFHFFDSGLVINLTQIRYIEIDKEEPTNVTIYFDEDRWAEITLAELKELKEALELWSNKLWTFLTLLNKT